MSKEKIVRGSLLHFLSDPAEISKAYEYLADGALWIVDGHIKESGPAESVIAMAPKGTPIDNYRNCLIVPGFVDTHVHYPQTEMIASHGKDLLDWLNNYTFPVERQFADPAHCEKVAKFFVSQLLSHGTTTAMVFSTVHAVSADSLFQEAHRNHLRLMTGKVLMDRNAPDYLLDTPKKAYEESTALIKKWHGKGRLQYAVTPRFAPTSSPEQLEQVGKLLSENPSVYLQTHLSENKEELAWVKSLFPEAPHYLGVYDRYKLLGERSIFAHSIHLCEEEFSLLEQTNSAVAFCPTSNLFLGSGLFHLKEATERKLRFGIGTDVGAGTSFSILHCLNEGYKIAQLQKYTLSPFRALYLATLGGAKALCLQDKIGNFQSGKEADFVVIDPSKSELCHMRFQSARDLDEKLLILMTLGEERHIRSTYVMGEKISTR